MNTFNDLDMATGHRYFNDYSTMAIQFELLGYHLIKTDPGVSEDAAYYLVHAAGGGQPLADLDAARACLIRLAGVGDGEG